MCGMFIGEKLDNVQGIANYHIQGRSQTKCDGVAS